MLHQNQLLAIVIRMHTRYVNNIQNEKVVKMFHLGSKFDFFFQLLLFDFPFCFFSIAFMSCDLVTPNQCLISLLH